jgi:hypothetical protein
MCEDGTLFGADKEDNVYELNEAGVLGQFLEPGVQVGRKLFKAKPGNPNAAFKEIPGAPPVKKDLAGNPVTTGQGQLSATGTVGQKRAQDAANNTLARQRKQSADAQAQVNKMSGPNPQVKTQQTPPNYAGNQMTAAPKNAPAGPTPPNAGLPQGISVGKLGAAEEKGIAALTKAEQAAVKAEVNAMSAAAKANWIKRYPNLAKALGLVVAGLGLGYLAGKDNQDPNPTPPGPGPNPKPNPGPKPAPAPTPGSCPTDPNDPRIVEINQLFYELSNAETPEVQQELQSLRLQFGKIMKDANIGSLGGQGAAAGSAKDAADDYKIPGTQPATSAAPAAPVTI